MTVLVGAAPGERIYTVQRGDTLSGIAQHRRHEGNGPVSPQHSPHGERPGSHSLSRPELPLSGLVGKAAPALTATSMKKESMKRYSMVIGIRPEKIDEYRKLHAAVWPDVLKMIQECHIRNYSIFLRKLDDGQPYLFSYFEYTGSDFRADMAKMAAHPETQRWWAITEPCQQPLADRAPGAWWAEAEEVFHLD
jgi:L-rhamnose mutarotase